MDPRDDVEFLADGRAVIGSDDEVVGEGPRRIPRWAVWTAGVAAVGGLVVALAARGAPDHPTAPPGPAESWTPVAVGSVPPEAGVGEALRLGPAQAYDVAVGGGRLYVLQNGVVVATDPAPASEARTAPPRRATLPRIPAPASARLVLDAQQQRLWVVVEDVPDGMVVELDARSLRQLGHTTWDAPIGAAAALDGHLYLSTTEGIADVGPGAAHPVLVAGLRGHSGPIVADTRRNRLLVAGAAPFSHVLILRPGEGVTTATGVIPFAKPTLGITSGGHIWAGGFGDRGAQLVRLDPHQLSPTSLSPLSAQLDPGAIIVAAGDRSIWVRATESTGPLWCVDASSGRDAQEWNVSGPVTSRTGSAFAATGTAARSLTLEGCPG
jgi:hypothetical protein